ncbi:MAG: methyltransferase domain-containing protein [Williamsia sp.]|nr:methyltransferase domain-containing protein [Williamsia sp.]
MEPAEIVELKSKIATGGEFYANIQQLGGPVESGLKGSNNEYAYPVVNGILLMLKDVAIPWQSTLPVSGLLDTNKQWVRDFYDQKGWLADHDGNYNDAVIYEDLRAVSADYIKKCHVRVGRYIHPQGKYLLDAASGSIQYPEYLAYSRNYEYHICADFSFQALTEAKKKLGAKGIYILCDITQLPIKKNTVDSFISLHTIYHIPKDQQAKAIRELYRVLRPGGKGVVVYDWFKHSPWMNTWLFPFRAFVFAKNRVLRTVRKLTSTKLGAGRLYFYAHTLEYFRKTLPPFQLRVWRSVSVPFLRYYIHPWLFGKQILDKVYEKEEQSPEECGRKGEYPMLVFEKEDP